MLFIWYGRHLGWGEIAPHMALREVLRKSNITPLAVKTFVWLYSPKLHSFNNNKWYPNHLSNPRLVLGLHLSGWSSGSSPKKVWRHVSGAGQQSSSVHAGPVSEDPLWTHQCTHRVQQGLFLAGLHFPRPASPAVLPRCSQPHTALHGLRPHDTRPGV